MTNVIEMQGWQARKATAVAGSAPLECPSCETLCNAVNVDADQCTTYRCVGHGHRALTWRIDASGAMMRGASGRRYY